jgi:predicted AlkP superfamily pyrophosphatase or phosphodiesterase
MLAQRPSVTLGRMRARTTIRLVVPLLAFLGSFAAKAQAPAAKPKLVVAIIVDQFRYDYLTRFRQDYHAGFDQLLTQGADFTNAFYAQVPTVTAVGHSIFLSGAMPAVSGIVSNAWYDRDEKKGVTSVCDWNVKTVGGHQGEPAAKCTDADPASPKRLMVTTLGDELRDAYPESKVIGISIKARGAILPSGHRAAGAFWFDDVTGNFVTSSFYMDKLPEWAGAFNDRKLPAKYVDMKWKSFPDWDFHAAAGSREPYAKLPASPWGNELIEQFAEQAVAGEKLGQRGPTDLLTVSFSSNDYVGHRVGPDAPEVRDMAIRTDQLLGKLFHRIDQAIGMKNVVVVLSADHGVASTPQHAEENHLPGGYVKGHIEDAAETALNDRFGKANWLIHGAGETSLYLNPEALESAKVEVKDVYRVAKEALLANPRLHVARVYSKDEQANGMAGDFIARAVANGYNPKRSGDLYVILEPGYMMGSSGTTHSSPYAYDRHVPVLFMGPGIKAGRYNATIAPNDIAPTLATLLDIQTPSGSSGRVLVEMLTR